MADVTISSLPQGTPAGNNIVPYSTGVNTLGVPVSALFQNTGSNIGINTTNVPSTLTVNGDMHLLAYGKLNFSNTAGTSYINAPQSNHLALYTAGESRIRIDSIGNVGIGTVTPKRLLHIEGSTPGAQQAPLHVGYGDDSVNIGVLDAYPTIFGWNGNANNAHKPLSIRSTTAIQLFLNTNGNVGIGTTTPTSKLHISGDARVTGDLKVDSGYIDTTGTTVSLANNAYIDFPLASGLLIVNCMTIDGSVSAYLVGGTGVVRLGTSIGNPPGTVTFVNAAPPFYRFTNTFGATQSFSFCFMKTRSYA